MTTVNTAYNKLVTALNEAVAANKVLDVSGVKEDGTGSRKINTPKTNKGTKKWVADFPVVSDNYASFAIAMRILGNDYLPLADQYYQRHGGQKIMRAPKATTTTIAPTRLGPVITAFPVFANTPAPITIVGPVKTVGAKSPGAKTPKTPKVPKSPTVRQPAILQIPTGQQIMAPVTVPRPYSPPRTAGQQNLGMTIATPTIPRPYSPPRAQPGTVLQQQQRQQPQQIGMATPVPVIPRPYSPPRAQPLTRQLGLIPGTTMAQRPYSPPKQQQGGMVNPITGLLPGTTIAARPYSPQQQQTIMFEGVPTIPLTQRVATPRVMTPPRVTTPRGTQQQSPRGITINL